MQLAFSQFSSHSRRVVAGTPFVMRRPLLLLHGLFGSKRNWQSIAKNLVAKLGEEFTVFTLDLRNHGESPQAASMSYQDMAEDILKFIDQQQLQDNNIIGHSMGGKVAMQIALQAPSVVRRMVVLDIAPIVYEHDFSPLINAMNELPLQQIKNRECADGRLREAGIQSAKLRQFLLQNLHRNEQNQFYWCINLPVIQSCMADILGFPDCRQQTCPHPVLFLKGEHSDYIKRPGVRKISELFPSARFITIENTGHWLHSEDPGSVTQAIVNFLSAN